MKTVSKSSLRLLGSVLLCLSATVNGVTYAPALEESRWRAQGDMFGCTLSHGIPFYGDAVFSRRAGEHPRFYLSSQTSRMQAGKAALVAESPIWRPNGERRELGLVPVKQGRQPVALGRQYSERMLAELQKGMQLVLTRTPWYEKQGAVRVALAPVNFQKPYRQYLDCLTDLLPVNFDQVSRTKVYFPSGSEELPKSARRKLDNVILYIKADAAVTGFYVDGHSDSKGNRADNLELSKMRAEMVAQYLINKGIEPERITTRWHGERYPVSSNRNRKGRDLNRRVTIRLEKGGSAVNVAEKTARSAPAQASLPAGTPMPKSARTL